ncbi:MAG TPA: heme-binding protein [Bacteroidales bacterium]|nr:heme-binding protein [Bacteroidales bacterium]HPS50229.1 heme-binding protein [Bacteroidales bacterium]
MEVFIKKSISLETAARMTRAAIDKAVELGISVAVTVVDESGILKHFARMDNAPLIAVDASRKKALTAAGFGLPTGKAWFDFIKEDPILREGVHDFTDFMLMGGGVPVIDDNRIIGAIGVSGNHYEEDQQCAHAALNCLEN